MSFRGLPSTPKCTVGMGQVEVQFYEAEQKRPDVSVGQPDGFLNCEIGLKLKQLAEGGAHLCTEGHYP
jgi:hypothetical protein